MSEKVVFDTNKLRDKDPNLGSFFGNRSELERFSKVAEIIIPDMVFEELKRQKKRSLEGKKQSFLDNPIHWILGTSKSEREGFDIESHISKLENEEVLSYSVIKLNDYSVIEQMKELALQKAAPFENGENTDKGFKDAYTYFTILEYLKTIEDPYVFFVCKDGRFREAFESNERVRVISDFDEFEKWRISYFQEDYFIEQLKEKIVDTLGGERVSKDINKDSIIKTRININGNWIVQIINKNENITFRVEVDFATKEIIAYIAEERPIDEEKNILELIQSLVHSGSFDNTDDCVYYLKDYVQYFMDSEIINIIEGSVQNNQIYGKTHKSNFKEFIMPLFEYKQSSLDSHTIFCFNSYFK